MTVSFIFPKDKIQSKIHRSQHIKTENKRDKANTKPLGPVKPTQSEEGEDYV